MLRSQDAPLGGWGGKSSWSKFFPIWGGGGGQSPKIWTFLSEINGKLAISSLKLPIFGPFGQGGGGSGSLATSLLTVNKEPSMQVFVRINYVYT